MGVVYIALSLVVFSIGLWAGLSIGEGNRRWLEEQLAAQKVANEALRRQANATIDATGAVLAKVRSRDDVPADPSGVIVLFGDAPDPSAGPPAGGTPGPDPDSSEPS